MCTKFSFQSKSCWKYPLRYTFFDKIALKSSSAVCVDYDSSNAPVLTITEFCEEDVL